MSEIDERAEYIRRMYEGRLITRKEYVVALDKLEAEYEQTSETEKTFNCMCHMYDCDCVADFIKPPTPQNSGADGS